MSEFEQNGFRGLWLPGRRLDGEFGVSVIAKRRFDVDMSSAACVPAEATPEYVMASEYRDPDAPMSSSVALASETALYKPKVDVIVHGIAHAPGGKAVRKFDVRVRIADVLDRTLRIIGPRTVKWNAPKKKLTKKQRQNGERQPFPPPTFGRPKTLQSLPLIYEHAYGGSGALILEAHLQEAAEKFQEEAKAVEERRERKKEIEAELRATEEAEAEEAAKAKAAEAGGLAAVGDAEARSQFEEAFAGGEAVDDEGTRVLDAATMEEMAAEEAAALVEASPMRLSQNRPEGVPDQADATEADSDEEAPEGEAVDPQETGTSIIDLTELEQGGDELKGALDMQDAERRRQLRDVEGTLIVRTDGMEEVALADDAWIDEAQQQPAEEGGDEPEESPYPEVPNLANPSGCGYCVSALKDAVEGVALPSIEYPDRPLTPEQFVVDLTTQDLASITPAAGFGAYGAGWYPRARLAGVMPWDVEAAEEGKVAAIAGFDPEDPDDKAAIQAIEEMEIPVMQAGWFQEAHPAMQVDEIRGDEEVFLENFSPSGPLFFRLPGVHPTASIDLGKGHVPVPMRIDTLTIDAEAHEAPSVTVVWRGWFPMASLEVLTEAPTVDVRLGAVDQQGWLEAKRGADVEAAARTDGEALTDEAMEEAAVGADAHERYREDVHLKKSGARDDVGVPRDEGGTAIVDLGEERALSDDAWFEEVEADKAAFEEDAAAKAEAARVESDKALKKKAGEMADEELGIDREKDEE